MPLNLPDKLPAIELLKEENIFVIDTSRATQQDIRPLRIVVLNLMPLKITTETDLVRLLSNTPLQVEISFMKIKSHAKRPIPWSVCTTKSPGWNWFSSFKVSATLPPLALSLFKLYLWKRSNI